MAIKSHPRPYVYEVQVNDLSEVGTLTTVKDRTRVHVKGNPGADYIYREDIPFADAPPGSIEAVGYTGSFILDSADNNFGYIDGTTDLSPAGLYFVDTDTITSIELAPSTGNLRRRHFVVTTNNDNRGDNTPIGTMSLPSEQIEMVNYTPSDEVFGKFTVPNDSTLGAFTLRIEPVNDSITGTVIISDDTATVIFSEHFKVEGGVNELTLRPDYKVSMPQGNYLVKVVLCDDARVAMVSDDTGFRSNVSPGYLYAKAEFTTESVPATATRLGSVEACTDAITEETIGYTTYSYQTFDMVSANTLKSLYLRLGISGTSTVIVRVILLDSSDNLIHSTNVMITGDNVYKIGNLNIPLMSGTYRIGVKTITNTTDAKVYTTIASLNDIVGGYNGTSQKMQCRLNFGELDTSKIVTVANDPYVIIKTGNGYNNLNDNEILVYSGQEVVITDVKPNQYHIVLTGDDLNRDRLSDCEITMSDILNITNGSPAI